MPGFHHARKHPPGTGAIRHAAGVTIRKVPALPHRVHAALVEAGQAVSF